MKKGSSILLLICALSFCVILGVFLGRNLRSEYIQVPDGVIVSGSDTPRPAVDPRIDLNKATKAQLTELPGIGDVLAQRILDYRAQNGPFSTTKDLLNVSGIGEGKLKQIEERIKIGE